MHIAVLPRITSARIWICLILIGFRAQLQKRSHPGLAEAPIAFPKLIGTFAAQTLAGRYDADPSAAGWRRFGRLRGFTNCKPKYRKPDGLFPFVRLKSDSGEQYAMAEVFVQEITKLFEDLKQE
jgi:RepB DNA-primase from phage plasmid